MRVVRGLVPAEDRVVVDGVMCTSLACTALQVALGRPLLESLVVLDSALRRLALSYPDAGGRADWQLAEDRDRTAQARRELLGAYDRLAPTWYAAPLLAAVMIADPRAETALESASRGLLLDAGLPAPDLQVWVRGDDGHWYRCDLGWQAHRVLGEADGRVKYTDADVLWREKRRQDAILAAGKWRSLVRWTAEDVWRSPDRLITRVARALRE